MPWLQQVWDDVGPSLWATVSHAELKAAIKRMEQAQTIYSRAAFDVPQHHSGRNARNLGELEQ